MEERLKSLYKELEFLLKHAPVEDDVVLQIKGAFDLQIFLVGKESIIDFLSHCGNTVPQIIRG